MSAASLASYVYSKFSGSGALTSGGSSDMKNLSRNSSPNPKLTAVWRTKPQKSDDIPNSSPTFKEDGSLLRLLRTKSMPSLVLDKGSPIRQTAPVVMPFSPTAKSDTSLDHSTSSSLASPITSRHVNPRRNLDETDFLESSTNTSITTPPPSPSRFTAPHVKITRSVSDGHIIRRRKQQLRNKTLDFPPGCMPSVKTLRLKFDTGKQTDYHDSSRSMASQDSYLRVNKEKPMSGDKIKNKNGEPPMTKSNTSGHETPEEQTKNKKLVRHESLRRFEPQHNEVELKEREEHISLRSVKSLLKHFESTVHSSKDDETTHVSQRQSRPLKRVVQLSSPELQRSLEGDQENEPETKIANGNPGKVVFRQRSKSLPAPRENKRSSLANIPANVHKLKMHFERQSGPVEVQPSQGKLREPDKPTLNPHEQTKPDISGNLAKREDGYENSAKAKGNLRKQESIGKVHGSKEQEDECPTLYADSENQANEEKVPKSPSVKTLRKHFEVPTSPQLSHKGAKERPIRRRHTIVSTVQQEFETKTKTPDQKLPQTTHVKDTELDYQSRPHASVKSLLRQFESQYPKENASEEMPERVIIKEESLTPSYVRVKPIIREESLIMINKSHGSIQLRDDDSDEEFYNESDISLELKVQGSVDYDKEDLPEGGTRRGVLERNFARTESSSSEYSSDDEQISTRKQNDNWRSKKLQEQSDRDLMEQENRKWERQENRKWEREERETMDIQKLDEITLQRERERTALMQAEEECKALEKAEHERIQQEEEQRRQMREKAEKENLAREKADDDDERREREKLQQEERERAEQERREKEWAQQERKERERLEHMERERVKREQEERETLERERRKQEKEELERREQERRLHEDRERREYEERERAKQEQRQREQMEQERENQKKEQERKERERTEQEEIERERAAQERREREKAELERKELERQEKEKAELERKELERQEKEKAELERKEVERQENEKAELERRELEREEKEKAEIKRREQEKNQLERERGERKQAEREILEREKAVKADQEMAATKKVERDHKKREEEEETQRATQMERDKERAEQARLQREQETEELMKRRKVSKLVDKFITLQAPENETKIKGDGSSEALKENLGEGRRESDVSVLIEKFAQAKKRSSSASSHSSEENSSSKQGKETSAPIPTAPSASAKNVPGKVRNLNPDELRFFSQDGAAFEPFVRSQSLRAKKNEPTPFQHRGGSLRVKSSEPRPVSGDAQAMPKSCRQLRPDELRFFAMANNNIYSTKKPANKHSQPQQDFRLGSQDDPRKWPTLSPGDDQGYSDNSDTDSDTSLLRDYDRDDESTDEALLLPVEHLDMSAIPYHDDDDDDDEAHFSSLTTMDSVIKDDSAQEFPMNFHLSKIPAISEQSMHELGYLGSLSHGVQMHCLDGEDDCKHNVTDDSQLHKLVSDDSVYGTVCEIINSDIQLSCDEPKTSTPLITVTNTARASYGSENLGTTEDGSSPEGYIDNATGILKEAVLDIKDDHQHFRQRPVLSKFHQTMHRDDNYSNTANSIPNSELPEGLQGVLHSIGVMASPTDAQDHSMTTPSAFDQRNTPEWTNDENKEGITTKPIEDYFLHIDESKEYLSDKEFAVFCILVALLSLIMYFVYDFFL